MHYYSIINSLLIVFWFCAACANSLEDLERIKVEERGNIERATDVEILYSDSAIVRLRIKAPYMRNLLDNQKPRREFPKGVWVDFFDANQQRTSQLTAKYAEYKEMEKIIELRDSIELWNYKNERLETEQLIWNEATSRIYTDKFVKITTPTQTIWGYGFSSNMEFTAWEMDSVSGTAKSNTLLDGR
jgi:LPS export ABC transporter protein LptC